MSTEPSHLEERLHRRGISRRMFLSFCGMMAATLALPLTERKRIATALAAAPRLPVVWLEFQDCTGDTESFLRSSNPTVASILLELISLNYHETLMVPSGAFAHRSLEETVATHPGGYVAIVEGAIPTGLNGAYCTIGGRTALSIAEQVLGSAMATIAVGACATDGGWVGSLPNPTSAVGVRTAVPGVANYRALPGCPMNVVNLTAVLTYYLTYGRWPEADDAGRPHFAYADEIHENCERKQHYDAKRFVLAWGDQGHRHGWCLFKMGCRGPETDHNCPEVKWNDATSWPVGSGHGCIGCAAPRFWDTMTPFYRELDDD